MTSIDSGIYTILYAFFSADGSLDRNAMRTQVQACIANGAHGLAVLGLATEVNKLSFAERCQIIDWAIEDADAYLPVLVTIGGSSIADQQLLANYAVNAGASGLIFQPPPQRALPESFYFDFFDEVMAPFCLPMGIQNAPEYLGVGLGLDNILKLADRHPYFQLLKGEASAVQIEVTVSALKNRMPVFNGRGGLELLDNLRCGCAGVIVAPDCFDYQVRIFEQLNSGEVRCAENTYSEVLPSIVFVMQSLETLITYGKRIAAWRMGFEVIYDRQPALLPSEFGLCTARAIANTLGRLWL